MCRTSHGTAGQYRLKLTACLESLQFEAASNCQTFAAFGAAGVDHSTTATGFHANQEAVSTGAFNLGGLVSAFHFENPKGLNDGPQIFKK